jgi:hypothetical protein
MKFCCSVHTARQLVLFISWTNEEGNNGNFDRSHPDWFFKIIYKIYISVEHNYLFTNYAQSDMFWLERVIIRLPYLRHGSTDRLMMTPSSRNMSL